MPRPTAPPHQRGLWWLLVPAAAAIGGLTALASATWTSGRDARVPAAAQIGAGVTPAAPVTNPAPAPPTPSSPAPAAPAPAAGAVPPAPASTPVGPSAGAPAPAAPGSVVAPQYPVLGPGGQQPPEGASQTSGTDGGDAVHSGSGSSDSGPQDGSVSSSTSTSSTSTSSTTTTQPPEGTTGDR